MKRRVLLGIYLTIIFAMSAAYFTLSPTPTTKLVLYNGVGFLSLLGMIVGIRMHRTR